MRIFLSIFLLIVSINASTNDETKVELLPEGIIEFSNGSCKLNIALGENYFENLKKLQDVKNPVDQLRLPRIIAQLKEKIKPCINLGWWPGRHNWGPSISSIKPDLKNLENGLIMLSCLKKSRISWRGEEKVIGSVETTISGVLPDMKKKAMQYCYEIEKLRKSARSIIKRHMPASSSPGGGGLSSLTLLSLGGGFSF